MMNRKNYLFCKGNRKKGLWLLAKVRDTYAKYMYEDYENEENYLSSLSDYEKEWLNDFLQGYYHQNKGAMDRLNFPLMLRRERYNQHRGVKNDVFNKANRWQLEEHIGTPVPDKKNTLSCLYRSSDEFPETTNKSRLIKIEHKTELKKNRKERTYE